MEGGFEGLDPDHDLALAHALQDQENADLPFQWSNTLITISVQSQLVYGEAAAEQCQALEYRLPANTSLNNMNAEAGVNTVGPPSVNESSSSGISLEAIEQDNVDPDDMTYEERSALTDRMGNESRGLSDDLISYLPRSKYNSGFFSRRNNSDECVICKLAYQHRDKLITLPCNHYYHAKCISKWLRISKACPICKYEVFG